MIHMSFFILLSNFILNCLLNNHLGNTISKMNEAHLKLH